MTHNDSDKRRAENAEPSPAARQNDSGSPNTVVRNPAPDAAPPTPMPQIYGSYKITRC